MFLKEINDGYITAVKQADVLNSNDIEITETEFRELSAVIESRPEPSDGMGLRLTESLTWELYELPIVEAPTAYTEEQLTAMTNAELEAICEELGISSSMTKANMVELILSKQNA